MVFVEETEGRGLDELRVCMLHLYLQSKREVNSVRFRLHLVLDLNVKNSSQKKTVDPLSALQFYVFMFVIQQELNQTEGHCGKTSVDAMKQPTSRCIQSPYDAAAITVLDSECDMYVVTCISTLILSDQRTLYSGATL